MDRNDFLYGCRSGIQKAIRRGDLDLAKTCFDALWAEKEHKNWIKWRLTILVEEECLHLMGELAEFLALKSDDKEDWRKFIFRLVVASKSRDSGGVWTLATLPEDSPFTVDQPEIHMMREALSKEDGKGPEEIVDDVYEMCRDMREWDEYERKGLKLLKSRVGMGGMVGDRYCCIAAMIMLACRGTNKDLVQEDLKRGSKLWVENHDGRKQPKTLGGLPWGVFDMHTQAGKIALGIFKRNKMSKYEGLTEQALFYIWFHMESARVPKYLLQLRTDKYDEPISILENAYRLQLVRHEMSSFWPEKEAREIAKVWRDSMMKDVKGCVEWILKKRAEEKR